ncbi:hypothetical protein HBI56_123900 [Parastagonospora nodorum]|nr:hypothetical protein HBH51_126970 [Parastagonospora nodorum]KAH4076733.1 hypothetical protein HBH50_009590 [Parastagonospora nodorum]KAH4095784.1 hypothetical protein HBH48_048170 [Parastagonospora nodorum]KAH4118655.1 hypothetical protein HBH47_138450 [Parastagonospora nodorum]KAH4197536.1 hypothetical protein HBH42_058630 [Parastagonospora nodorum]
MNRNKQWKSQIGRIRMLGEACSFPKHDAQVAPLRHNPTPGIHCSPLSETRQWITIQIRQDNKTIVDSAGQKEC